MCLCVCVCVCSYVYECLNMLKYNDLTVTPLYRKKWEGIRGFAPYQCSNTRDVASIVEIYGDSKNVLFGCGS